MLPSLSEGPIRLDNVTLTFLFQLADRNPAVSEMLHRRFALEITSGQLRADAVGALLLLWVLRHRGLKYGGVF
jgi:hypothetical protein